MTKKLILVCNDAPTTAQYRRDLTSMKNTPVQGTTIWVQAKGDLPPGMNLTPFRTAFSRIPWKRSWFTHAIDDLQAVKNQKTPLTDNFLRLDTQPGDVDWFDDAGWDAIVEHFGIAAWVAKQGGVKGIAFDAEPYTKPFKPFDYKAQPEAAKHSFEDYLIKARQRGRQSMRAMKAEFPDATILTFFMASYFVESNLFNGPSIPRPGIDPKRALFLHNYGLYLAYLTGWLDEIPPKMNLVDGNEHAYDYSDPDSFFKIAQRIKSEGVTLFPPEVREKYRQQVHVGAGIYLDAHGHGMTLLEYEKKPANSTTLERNIAGAVNSVDEYVWLYGEQGRYWPEPKELIEWPQKEVVPLWDTRIPGFTQALRRGQAQKLPRPTAKPAPHLPSPSLDGPRRLAAGKPNLLKNGDFVAGPPAGKELLPGVSSDWGDIGAPSGWSYWQEELSKGRFDWDAAKKAARVRGVRSGSYLQTIEVKPGESYLLRARCTTLGTGLATISIGFKTPGGAAWLPPATQFKTIQPTLAGSGGETFELTARVPESAGVLVVLLNNYGQPTERDTLWWSSAELRRIDATSSPQALGAGEAPRRG